MPQLDKLSFATQYFWLTIFFWILYFFTINFFTISVFRAIRLRFFVLRFWLNFVYNFNHLLYVNTIKQNFIACSVKALLNSFVLYFSLFYKSNINSNFILHKSRAKKSWFQLKELAVDEI